MGAVRGGHHHPLPLYGGGRGFGGRIPEVEAVRPEAPLFSGEHCSFGEGAGLGDAAHDPHLGGASCEEHRDGRRGPQHVDDQVALRIDFGELSGEQGNIEVAEDGHARQYRPWRAAVLSSVPMDAPVGFFDSGVGGLSVARAFRTLAPGERILYFADTAWFPYGGRPPAEVRKRAFAAAHALIAGGAKLIVVACNTASAVALADLRAAFPVPFVGMVPGLKPATAQTRTGVVLVLATPNTLDGELFRRVQAEYGSGVEVRAVAGHGLAELVEQGLAGTAQARAALRAILGRHVAAGADVVVLGCTHYHFLAADIRALFPGVAVVDTSEAVARRAVAVLEEQDLTNGGGAPAPVELLASGPLQRLEAVARRLVPEFFPTVAETRA